MQRQEGFAEAGRKCRLRLGNAPLGASHLGGVAGEEVIHRLLFGQFGDRRQNPEGVTGEEDNVFGPIQLLQWLQRNMDSPTGEYELRLENDEDAVRIMNQNVCIQNIRFYAIHG